MHVFQQFLTAPNGMGISAIGSIIAAAISAYGAITSARKTPPGEPLSSDGRTFVFILAFALGGVAVFGALAVTTTAGDVTRVAVRAEVPDLVRAEIDKSLLTRIDRIEETVGFLRSAVQNADRVAAEAARGELEKMRREFLANLRDEGPQSLSLVVRRR